MKKINKTVIILSIFGGTAAMWTMDTIFHPELKYSAMFGTVYGCFSLLFLTRISSRKQSFENSLEQMISESDTSCTLSDLLKGLRVNIAPEVHTFMNVEGWEPMSYGKVSNGDRFMFAIASHGGKLPTVHLKEGVWKNNSVLIQSDYGYEPITDPDSVLAFLPVTESVTDTESVL